MQKLIKCATYCSSLEASNVKINKLGEEGTDRKKTEDVEKEEKEIVGRIKVHLRIIYYDK